MSFTKVRDARISKLVIPAPDSSIRGQASAGTHFDLDGRNMDSRLRGNDDGGLRENDDGGLRGNDHVAMNAWAAYRD
jgi:hypothetical protein